MPSTVSNTLSNPTQELSQERGSTSKKMMYYALKASSVALICIGMVGTVAGAAWGWPKVAGAISAGFSGMSSTAQGEIATFIASCVQKWFEMIAACTQMGGDIGGFCALVVAGVGGAILLGPTAIAFAVPILPGIALTMGGTSLWNYADQYKENS